MNCERVTELLPWYFNGSLEAEERQAVAGHLAGCEPCTAELAATRLAFAIYDAHLAPAVLTDLAAGRRPEGLEPELVERHLDACPHCQSDLELARESLEAVESEERKPAPALPFAPRPRAARGVSPYLAAAASVAAAASLVGWLWTSRVAERRADETVRLEESLRDAQLRSAAVEESWRERLAAAREENAALLQARAERDVPGQRGGRGTAPQLNVAVVDLFSTALLTRGAEGEPGSVSLPEGAQSLVLILNSQAVVGEEAGVELATEAGERVWSADGLRRNPTGDFTLGLPADSLRRGVTYRLVLRPRDGGEEEVFRFRVQ